MEDIKKKIKVHLQDKILPFWTRLEDVEYGGLYGYVANDVTIDTKAPKSTIYIARCLWFFASYDETNGRQSNKRIADSCYTYLKTHVYDATYGGVYYSTMYDGSILDDTKHTYAIAFVIYGLSAYAKTYHNEEAKAYAKKLFQFLQDACFNHEHGLYHEQFTRNVTLQTNTYLAQGLAPYTYNTHLHVVEAFTALYVLDKDAQVYDALLHLLDQFKNQFYHKEKHYIRAFLDEQQKEVGCLYSIAHDIEASWLFEKARIALAIEDEQLKQMIRELYQATSRYVEAGHMCIAYEAGVLDRTTCWWAQAEAMVGFLYAYEDTKDPFYWNLVEDIYRYTEENFFDKRSFGEWLSGSEPDGYLAGPWKAPYHTGRFALEFQQYEKRLGGD